MFEALSEVVSLNGKSLSVSQFYQEITGLKTAKPSILKSAFGSLLSKTPSKEGEHESKAASWKDSVFQYVNHFFQKSLYELVSWDSDEAGEDLLGGYMQVVREVFKVSPAGVEISAFRSAIEKMKIEIHKLDFETVMRGEVTPKRWTNFL